MGITQQKLVLSSRVVWTDVLKVFLIQAYGACHRMLTWNLLLFVGEWNIHDPHQPLVLHLTILLLVILLQPLRPSLWSHWNHHPTAWLQLLDQLCRRGRRASNWSWWLASTAGPRSIALTSGLILVNVSKRLTACGTTAAAAPTWMASYGAISGKPFLPSPTACEQQQQWHSYMHQQLCGRT